eukprot:9813282-Lingulodinium_polyedra.AAC.1
MKNTLILGHKIQLMQADPRWTRLVQHYGAPKHFKGPWDGAFGLMTHVLKAHTKTYALQEISEVCAVLNEWAQDFVAEDGAKYTFLEFMPEEKSKMRWLALEPRSI